MDLDTTSCYHAVRSRDARFDGRFFTGVVTTGIYCRSVCPARTPKRENVRFFPCAAAAEQAGFRPCRRCRPDASPGTPAWSGTSSTVSRALRLIAEGALDDAGVEELAERLGVGGRHLRRLFLEHLGAPPVAIAQTRRVHFARRLIDESTLPMNEIAIAAGFSSTRRFNSLMRGSFGISPSEMRRASRERGPTVASGNLILLLPFRPPYDWEAMIHFLGDRALPGVEQVDPGSYRRSVTIGRIPGWIEVRRSPGDHHLRLRLPVLPGKLLASTVERIRRIFDLDADPLQIATALERDPWIAPIIRSRPGLRLPGAWDPFELAVRAILGQQITVSGARSLAALQRIRGIGRWTAEYILIRAIGEPDLFPADDLALRRALAAGEKPLTERAATAFAARWRPWRSYATIHLWASRRSKRREKGVIR